MAEYATESYAIGMLAEMHPMKMTEAAKYLSRRLNEAHDAGRAILIDTGLTEENVVERYQQQEIERLKRQIAELEAEPDPPEEDTSPQSVGKLVARAVDWMIECWVEDRSKMEHDEASKRLIDAINSLRGND